MCRYRRISGLCADKAIKKAHLVQVTAITVTVHLIPLRLAQLCRSAPIPVRLPSSDKTLFKSCNRINLPNATMLMDLANAPPRIDTPSSPCFCPPAWLNRGRHLETSIWRSRVRRLQAGLVTPSQEARSSSPPDEGAAFSGWT